MLGAVSCSFRKEVKPYQPYEIWTRVLSWDRKWLYLVTHFVFKDAVKPRAYSLYPSQNNKKGGLRGLKNNEDAIFASALSKCVFKKGRLTISPENMLKMSGLLPSEPPSFPLCPTGSNSISLTREQSNKIHDVRSKVVESVETTLTGVDIRVIHDTHVAREGVADKPRQSTEEWTWERVECERRRGMELAGLLGRLSGLEHEFSAETEALGRHVDFW